ncbi:hypothetical protein [Aegicerativicinus sediminis]|uniref:hypothetical protein n=1 Tax=Aegicerativicinus sediminis TaxID=2893202 RepID=UPI001E2B577C|nr:hypothetical protein [Aegicerativicinus sediminis]
MSTRVMNLSDLKFNVDTWKRELRFHFNEMDTFQEQLEDIVQRETNPEALKKLEMFQNRIIIEKDVISKLLQRCKDKARAISRAYITSDYGDQLKNNHRNLGEDMRTYISMHYELKEDMMDFFLNYF